MEILSRYQKAKYFVSIILLPEPETKSTSVN